MFIKSPSKKNAYNINLKITNTTVTDRQRAVTRISAAPLPKII